MCSVGGVWGLQPPVLGASYFFPFPLRFARTVGRLWKDRTSPWGRVEQGQPPLFSPMSTEVLLLSLPHLSGLSMQPLPLSHAGPSSPPNQGPASALSNSPAPPLERAFLPRALNPPSSFPLLPLSPSLPPNLFPPPCLLSSSAAFPSRKTGSTDSWKSLARSSRRPGAGEASKGPTADPDPCQPASQPAYSQREKGGSQGWSETPR